MSKDGTIEYLDKTGELIKLENCGVERVPDLIGFYDRFSPKAVAQGLPPSNDRLREEWVNRTVTRSENFVARIENVPIGHCALVTDLERKDAEYIIFVIDSYRNRGIGSALTRLAVERAKELQLDNIWLTVECFNFKAICVYRKVGFCFCDEGDRERTMVLAL